jgi:hypothetical protein
VLPRRCGKASCPGLVSTAVVDTPLTLFCHDHAHPALRGRHLAHQHQCLLLGCDAMRVELSRYMLESVWLATLQQRLATQ